ncbi:hypothetical protein [Candidatus Accumulibacter sp. ACC003]|uniref:tetratricopeptide repeat protein n=1 Tax=Candidatus Accumulibacter sp. ACC003 TaxID=2823334 RepID=UPI0025C7245D|nr:hypothetical protein [Candidatus Accumulibacter sp. ACC003]
MSSKKRTTATRSAPGAAPLSPEVRARQALDAAHYREAIELHKALLKQERRGEWLDGLADSYAGRAAELAAKGMFPEALVVWRNRATLCARPLLEGPYLDWLLRAGEHAAALRLLSTTDGLSATAAAELETALAAVVLTSPDSDLALLTANSPLLRHRANALAAIAACCRGDHAELDEHLRAIPFRSPYRDLRFLLKSLALLGSDPAQAAELIARVVVGGPFEALAKVVRAAIVPDGRWLAALHTLDEDGRQLLLDLKGCPEDGRSLLFDLARLGSLPAPAKVVELLLRRKGGLSAPAATLCLRLLPYADARIAAYHGAFAALDEGARVCSAALAAELHNDLRRAEAQWLRAADLLPPLPAALVLRHLFELIVGDGDLASGDEECVSWLYRSLALDPDDVATYLKLSRIYRQTRELKAARAIVERALERFANDAAVLLEAVEVALAGNAFKKAVGLAKRVLELDPINSRVRALIGQAHLSHARKQIRARRRDAAAKELDLAAQWLTSASERSVVKLLRGLSADDQPATALLCDAAGELAELGGNLLAAFHVLLECVRVDSPAPASLRRAGIDLSGKPTTREVVAVAHALNALDEDGARLLPRVLDSLRAPLRRAAANDFSEAEAIAICEALLRRDERSLLQAFADVGLKRWPARPIFVYFTTFARHGSRACFVISDREGRALERAHDEALDAGDQRTALRIHELLSPPATFDGGAPDDFGGFGGLEDIFTDSGEALRNPRTALEMMLQVGGEEEVIRTLREGFSDGEFRQFARAAGGNRKRLARLLIDAVVESMEQSLGAAPLDALPPPAPRPRQPPKPPVPPVHDDRQKDLFDD